MTNAGGKVAERCQKCGWLFQRECDEKRSDLLPRLRIENGEIQMTEFVVLVERRILTMLKVEADSSSAARRIVNEYGPDLAAVDFPNSGEAVTAKIKGVMLA